MMFTDLALVQFCFDNLSISYLQACSSTLFFNTLIMVPMRFCTILKFLVALFQEVQGVSASVHYSSLAEPKNDLALTRPYL